MSESRHATGTCDIDILTQERLKILKLRAETFASELALDWEHSLATGQSMLQEQAATLERERQLLLAQIKLGESNLVESPPSLDAFLEELDRSIGSIKFSHTSNPPPYSPGSRITRTSKDRGQNLVRKPLRVTTDLSLALVIESDAETGDKRLLNHSPKRFKQHPIEKNDLPENPTNHSRILRQATPSGRLRSPPPLIIPIKPEVQTTLVNGIRGCTDSLERRYSGDDYPFLLSCSPTSTVESPVRYHPTNDNRSWPKRSSTHPPLSPLDMAGGELGLNVVSGRHHSVRSDAKESLHRLILSSTRLSHQKFVNEKNADITDEKPWAVFTEDNDEPCSPMSEIFPSRRRLTSVGNHRSGTIGTALVQSPNEDVSECLTRTPLFSKVSPASKPLINFITSEGLADFCERLTNTFQNVAKYKNFLDYQDQDAQFFLNVLQELLDHPQLEKRFRPIFLTALIHLSRKSELYPQCFTLSDVIREGEYPITDGHFGEIYKAHLRGRVTCLKVAKVYSTSDYARLYKAFAREAVLWAQLSHVNILPFLGIHRLGDARNRIGLVSLWIEHGNINEFLKKHPDTDRSLLISDVAAGMLYLHENAVVHGGLRGAAILITDSGRACLTDFGFSSIADTHDLRTASSLSSTNFEGGPVRFLAPELVDPESECRRSSASDIYAFALVCYEIFTGNHPFPDVKNDYTVMLKVLNNERPARPPVRMCLDRGLTNRMWRLMEDCWEHNPKDRISASEIVGRLPYDVVTDKRRNEGWGDLSPSRFRASSGNAPLDQDGDLSGELSPKESTKIGHDFTSRRWENVDHPQLDRPARIRHSKDEEQAHSTLISHLTSVFEDVDAYKRLLSYRNKQAQLLLDTFQMLMDTSVMEPQFRRSLVVAMYRLSKKSRRYPGRYDLKNVHPTGNQPITSGGFADIYLGQYKGESICLKAIRVYKKPHVDYMTKQFSREAILWGQLSHPNVLPFYGIHRLRSQLCLVSPWAENGNLSDFLKCNRDTNRILLCSDTAEGIAYLHANDIIHGDLKGANVLVDGSGRACLADFGLSAITDPTILNWTSHSAAASKGGSVRWQAPELNNVETDQIVPNTKASDVYAWSCVSYEIFTGCLPFFECPYPAVVVKIVQGHRPSQPLPSSPAWIEWGMTDRIWDIMNNCWKRNPGERPTVDEIINQLALGKPIDLRPTRSTRRLNSSRVVRVDVHSALEIINAII